MKTRWAIFAAVMVGVTGIGFQQASAEYAYSGGIEVRQVNDFYEPLAQYGNWVQVGGYGWCWYPTYVANDWRPYANGSWSMTDDGWYWSSSEPWAWATYHYGRWVSDPLYGWVWVPGTEWAAAWVSWREGDDYVGWAPLPPSCDFGPGVTTIEANQVVCAPSTFVFIERAHFCEPIRPSILVVNQTFVNRTVNITRIQRVNQVVINRGPRIDNAPRYVKHVEPHPQFGSSRPNWTAPQQPRAFVPQGRAANVPQANPVRDNNPPRFASQMRQDRPQQVINDLRRDNNRGRDNMVNSLKSSKDSERTAVLPVAQPRNNPRPTAQVTVDTSRNDAGRGDSRHGRDIGEDSPRNHRHNGNNN